MLNSFKLGDLQAIVDMSLAKFLITGSGMWICNEVIKYSSRTQSSTAQTSRKVISPMKAASSFSSTSMKLFSFILMMHLSLKMRKISLAVLKNVNELHK